MNRKKAPEIFSDKEALSKAFLYIIEPSSPQGIRTSALLADVARDCNSWSEFLARVRAAKKGEKDRNQSAVLNYLEYRARYLEEEEEKNR